MTHVADEFLSAHVDGEALSDDDAAHLADCRACQERLAAFRGVVSAVASPVTLPPAHVREAAVAAAFAPPKPAAKPGVARRLNALSAAAVLAVAVGVGAWALSQVGRDSTNNQFNEVGAAIGDDQAESADSSAARSGAAGGGSNAAGEDMTTMMSLAVPDAGAIGDFSATEPVVARYRAYEADPNSITTMMGELPCPAPPDAPVTWHASLTFNGELAYARVVLVGESATPQTRRLEVLSRTTCAVLATQIF